MKSKKENTRKSKPKYTRQNKDLYNAFVKAKRTNTAKKTTLVISGVKIAKRARGKLNNKQAQYFFKRLGSREWKYDSKTKTFKTVGRSPFNKKTVMKYQRDIELATKEYTKLLYDLTNGVTGLDDLTDDQLSVLGSVYNSGLTFEEFKERYPEDYERLFGPDSEEL